MGLEEDLQKTRTRSTIPKTDFLSSGSTLLNLACSGMPDCAIFKGGYFWGCGDSSSGKTMLMLTILAEAAKNKNWDGYDLFFDDVENGALMDFTKFFGKKMQERVKAPHVSDDGNDVFSATAEEFYYSLDDKLTAVEKGKAKPFLYVLDSMDALSTKYEAKKFQQAKKAYESESDAAGSFGDGKAKQNSTNLRVVISRLRDTGSSLIILSQTRDNVDGGMFEPKSVTSGGRALKFYASLQLWTSPGPKLTKTVNGIERQIGITSRIAIKKNRLTGKEWSVEVPIYHSYGIDDIGSCVDFLVKEKRWKAADRGKGNISATELGLEGKREHIIAEIEEQGLQFDLKGIVEETFRDVEAACDLGRKPKYE